MRRSNYQLAIGLAFVLQACTTFVGGTKPTEMSSIGAGSSQVQVENLLGQPVLERNSEVGSTAVYRYQSSGVSGACEDSRCAYFLFLPFLWPFQEYYAREEAAEGMRFLTVIYDDNGQICQAYGNYSEPDTALGLLEDANEGDAAAKTTLSVRAMVYAGEIPRQCRADLPSKAD